VPTVGVKLCPEIVPVPVTTTKPDVPGVPPWPVMVELAKLNVNPSTDQKLDIGIVGGVLNDQGATKEVPSPTLMKVARFPSTDSTLGAPVIGVVEVPCQAVTSVAVAAEEVSNSTDPPQVMLPVIGPWACAW